MNKIILSLVLITTLLAACKNVMPGENNTETEEEKMIPLSELLENNPNVKIGPLQQRSYQQKVNSTGTVALPSDELVSVHSKAEGHISHISYQPGDYVRKGALLFRISCYALIEKQRMLLETREQLWLAKKDFERKQSLFTEQAVTEKVFDQVKAKKDLLNASYKGLKAELNLIGINLEKLESEQIFQASVPIYSETSGHVRGVYVNKGQMVNTTDKLMDIVNSDRIHLELQVLAKDVPLIAIGQLVQFTLPKNTKILNAKISKINPVLNQSTDTLTVYCTIDVADCEHIIPGMFVNADIEVSEREVWGLPAEAVIKEGDDYFVYLVKDEQLLKHLLDHPFILDDFVIFDEIEAEKFVVEGAYYVN